MKRSYKVFAAKIETFTSVKQSKWNKLLVKLGKVKPIHERFFNGSTFPLDPKTAAKEIYTYCMTFPQLDTNSNYVNDDNLIWDNGLSRWIEALKRDDYKEADRLRTLAQVKGCKYMKLPGNVFCRTP